LQTTEEHSKKGRKVNIIPLPKKAKAIILRNAVGMIKSTQSTMNRRIAPFRLLTHWVRDKEASIKISTHDFAKRPAHAWVVGYDHLIKTNHFNGFHM